MGATCRAILPMSELLGDGRVVGSKAIKDKSGAEDEWSYDTGKSLGACQKEGTDGGHERSGEGGRKEGCGGEGRAKDRTGAFADRVEMHGLFFSQRIRMREMCGCVVNDDEFAGKVSAAIVQ